MKNAFQKSAVLASVLILASSILLTACGKNEPSAAAASASNDGKPEVTELRYQGGAGSVTFPELAEDLGYFGPLKLKYIGNTISGPQDIQATVTGDLDFGAAFNGAIIKLIAAHAPIKAVVAKSGVDENTWGGYFVLDGSPIKSARDLIGKKIAVNTLGGHSEFMIKEYLRRGGLTEDEIGKVTLVVIPPVSSEQALRAGQVDVATLNGVLRDKALERGGIYPLFRDIDLFGKFSGDSYVFTEKFIKENPNTVRIFVEGTAKAIEWERVTPRDEVIARFEKIINIRGRKEDASAVKYWKSTGIAGKGGLIAESEFQTWIDWLVKDGTLKEGDYQAKDLYTNEFNPYVNETSK
ncbi:ABC transporter substrate-binding protein [Cohnella suwonensis]|uniref:ABC transporter substrate-binding protein n=1 Tax=Cohnella suwonensis TaxID=696072 RepID=A0ABW0LQH6_9BACL